MSSRKKILWIVFPVLIVLVIVAGAVRITASFGTASTPEPPSQPVNTAVAPQLNTLLKTLLNEGKGYTEDGYFEKTSSALVAAAAGSYNSRFRDLGELLVKDGL